ncbi:MAG TPA: hypothetical protein PK514_13015 [Spirochaetota bacterium]|nr:hypothetical protein [Spirochaetota bacterium]
MNDFAEHIDKQGNSLDFFNKFAHEKVSLDEESEVVYKYKGYRFFTIDIKNTPKKKLDAVLRECELIEKACWIAQENFFDYARKRNLLTYAVHEGKVIAFQIASYWLVDDVFIFDLDETMVMKGHRGKNLAMALSCINSRTYILRIRKIRGIRKMTFVGLTPNLRLVNLLDRIRHAIYFLDSTFNPSKKLLKIHDYLLEKKGESLVHDSYPFFLRNVFPGSLKPTDHTQKTSKRVRKMLPPGLDFNGRGDAFLFLCLFDKVRLLPVLVILSLKALGPGILFDKKLGFFSRKKYHHIYKYLSTDSVLFVERRKANRRKKDRIREQVGFVERRRVAVS